MLGQRVVLLSSSSGVACSSQRPVTSLPRRGPVIVTAGLKKETKKLAKTLRSHRKRLESLLDVHGAAVAVQGAVPQLTQAQLHAVLAEIAQLQTSLAAVRQQQRQLALAQAACDSSSDSDSDCEDAARASRPLSTAIPMVVQPVQQLPTQGNAAPVQQPASCTASIGAIAVASSRQLAGTAVAEAPCVDQEQPDLCQQLPPPQQYSTTGRVLVCQGKACMRKGALQVLQAVSHATAASPGVEVLPCKCLGKCKQAPALRVRTAQQPRSTLVTEVGPLEVPEIMHELLGAAECSS